MNELVINATKEGVRIALLKDKDLVECHVEGNDVNYAVGDLYLGTVQKVVPGLNAAFVDVGYEKDAFLHYLDLGPQFRSLTKYTKAVLSKKQNNYSLKDFTLEPEIEKLGKISQVLNKNQKVLVQISKEPISSKGPRISCDISIPGRFIVLVPFSNTINVSRKIADNEERKRLKRLVTSIKPENFGVIIRTVADGKSVQELDKDLKNCLQKWQDASKNLRTAEAPEKVLGEANRISTILRDVLNETFDSIVLDSEEAYEETKTYIQQIAPDKEKIVKLHTGKTKLFEAKGIEKQIKTLFGKSVSLPSGGYLIIEHTEALHVVDVNSGNKSAQEKDQENTALSTNLTAVQEVARQLRLRDMGGIIVVDFIDMKSQENRKTIYEAMKTAMQDDKAKSVVLPLSKFGLLQITRQRVRPELNITTKEVCPSCSGTGSISASIAVASIIEENIEYVLTKQNEKSVTVSLHPYLHSYFTKGIMSRQVKWFLKYKKWITLLPDTSLGLVEFHIHNKLGEEIEVL